MTRINYQIMTEEQVTEVKGSIWGSYKKYLPNYDELIKNSTCEEEANKWQEAKERKVTFTFNMVYATKQTCGHWEIFQTPYNEYHTLENNLKQAEQHAKENECTRCICGW